MAGGGGTSLEQTPTWAVAVVCFVLVAISIAIEHLIHLVGKFLKKRNKSALYEALEKIKAELMLLGFLSLLLTVGQGPISEICVSQAIAATWHPCSKQQEAKYQKQDRKLLSTVVAGELTDHHHGRILAAKDADKCGAKGKVAFVSTYGIHQLHIFIFVLAISHIVYCIITYALGRAKMSKWKKWEMETRTTEYQYTHDPERFRFTKDTSFGKRHLNFWSHSSFLLWIVCFFRQFATSVPKIDYLTLRHGFITAHLAPQGQANFNFQKYIKRSLEEDFKVVVGISPLLWLFSLVFLLFTTHGSFSYLYLPFIPIFIILLVGAKLQVIITQMGLAIQDKGLVIKGTLVVQPGDELFWFSRPRLLLYLIHFVLFQNAFQLAFFMWTWYAFGLQSCYHEKTEDIIIRIVTGVVTQILCSYVTLPLYALVTQMGTTMRPTIFNDKIVKALHSWHHSAKKHVKQSHHNVGSRTPSPSRPSTPMDGMSPVHLLHNYRGSEFDSPIASPQVSNFGNEPRRAVSPTHQHVRSFNVHGKQERQGREVGSTHSEARDTHSSPSHEIDINN